MFLLPLFVLVWEFQESLWYLFNLVFDISNSKLLVFKKFNLLCRSSMFLEGSFFKENLPPISSPVLFNSQNSLVLSRFACFFDIKYSSFSNTEISDFNRQLSYFTVATSYPFSLVVSINSQIFIISYQILLSFQSIIFWASFMLLIDVFPMCCVMNFQSMDICPSLQSNCFLHSQSSFQRLSSYSFPGLGAVVGTGNAKTLVLLEPLEGAGGSLQGQFLSSTSSLGVSRSTLIWDGPGNWWAGST